MDQEGQLGVYIHWPFCLAKCPYCDFNSHVRDSIDEEAWEQTYLKALEFYAGLLPGRQVVSVFFGGGTPSLMPAQTVESIFSRIQSLWPVANDIEVTLEANPTSVEAGKFKDFRVAGVNRVSLGVQSLVDADLKFLGREHSAQEALRAVGIANDVFDRTSFDLIYARPEQSLQDWEAELKQALPYTDGHMSLYQLTIERNMPFYAAHARGDFSLPKDELAADFYDLTQDILGDAGLPAYEVSNHARQGQESRHNLIYWDYGDYVGVGPGAHGRITVDGQKQATREHSAPDVWLERAGHNGQAFHPFETLSADDRFLEALMMGLRVREGVSLKTLEKAGQCAWEERLDRSKIEELEKQGWLTLQPERLVLEREGLLRLNAVIPFILRG